MISGALVPVRTQLEARERDSRRVALMRRRQLLEEEMRLIDAELDQIAQHAQAWKPTKAQQEVLEFIRAFRSREGHSPSFREIGEHFRITANAVLCHLQSMAKKGLVSWTREGRSLRVLERVE